MKAPRADGTESILVSSEYTRNPERSETIPKLYVDALGITVALAKQLSSMDIFMPLTYLSDEVDFKGLSFPLHSFLPQGNCSIAMDGRLPFSFLRHSGKFVQSLLNYKGFNRHDQISSKHLIGRPFLGCSTRECGCYLI